MKSSSVSKPRRMACVGDVGVGGGRWIVRSACNAGSSALVTRDGEVYIYGKDAAAAHTDHTTGACVVVGRH